VADALEEGVAEDAVGTTGPVQVLDPFSIAASSATKLFTAFSLMPSIMAVKVFFMKPSTRSGLLEST